MDLGSVSGKEEGWREPSGRQRQGVGNQWQEVSGSESPVAEVLAHATPRLAMAWFRRYAPLQHLLLLVLRRRQKTRVAFKKLHFCH